MVHGAEVRAPEVAEPGQAGEDPANFQVVPVLDKVYESGGDEGADVPTKVRLTIDASPAAGERAASPQLLARLRHT